MILGTLTNEGGTAGNRKLIGLTLTPGIWLHNPSRDGYDPRLTVGGTRSEGWNGFTRVFKDRTNPPDISWADNPRTGEEIHHADLQWAGQGHNSTFVKPTLNAPDSRDLLVLVEINGRLNGLCLDDARGNELRQRNDLLRGMPCAYNSSEEDPGFSGLIVVPQGTRLYLHINGEKQFMCVFGGEKFSDAVALCSRRVANESRGRLEEAAIHRGRGRTTIIPMFPVRDGKDRRPARPDPHRRIVSV